MTQKTYQRHNNIDPGGVSYALPIKEGHKAFAVRYNPETGTAIEGGDPLGPVTSMDLSAKSESIVNASDILCAAVRFAAGSLIRLRVMDYYLQHKQATRREAASELGVGRSTVGRVISAIVADYPDMSAVFGLRSPRSRAQAGRRLSEAGGRMPGVAGTGPGVAGGTGHGVGGAHG